MQIKSSVHKPALPPRKDPGLVQDAAEKLLGVGMAALRVPGALIGGTLVGGYSGAVMGHNEDHGVTAESVSKGMIVLNVAEGLVKSGVGGFLVAGPTGAMIGIGQEIVQETADLFMFIKGGGANYMGQTVYDTLQTKVEPGGGLIKGGARGMAFSAVSSTKAGASTGFNEGKGAIAGTVEAFREIGPEISAAKRLKGNLLQKMGRAVAGAVGAVLSGPAGLAIGLVQSTSDSDKEMSLKKQRILSVGATAATGIAAGAFGGPVGMVVGGLVGAVAGLVSAGSKAGFVPVVKESLARAELDDGDLGHEVGNKYRDIIQGTGVGGLAGMRAGWDRAQGP
jgi:hypothetical protein